jgi:hypothetical protein
MKTSEIFRLTKKYIKKDYEFICVAISALYSDGRISAEDATKTLKIIDNLLDGCYTLDSWILRNVKESGLVDNKQFDRKMKITRLAWLDYLITKYEKIGD